MKEKYNLITYSEDLKTVVKMLDVNFRNVIQVSNKNLMIR